MQLEILFIALDKIDNIFVKKLTNTLTAFLDQTEHEKQFFLASYEEILESEHLYEVSSEGPSFAYFEGGDNGGKVVWGDFYGLHVFGETFFGGEFLEGVYLLADVVGLGLAHIIII